MWTTDSLWFEVAIALELLNARSRNHKGGTLREALNKFMILS